MNSQITKYTPYIKHGLFFIVGLLIFTSTSFSQVPEIWGTTQIGANDFGVVFKTDQNGENYEVVHAFGKNAARWPDEDLFEASNGLIYGLTRNHGEYSNGVLYAYDPQRNEIIKKFDFYDFFTGTPATPVIEGPNGNIYGMTHGATSPVSKVQGGAIYEYNPITDSTKLVFTFEDTITGGRAYSGFCLDSTGIGYGRLRYGPLGFGVIFSFDFTTHQFKRLYDIPNASDGHGNGVLIYGGNDLFYGATFVGGTNNEGVLYSYNKKTSTYTKLVDLRIPYGTVIDNMILGPDDKLYGISVSGGINDDGVLFELDLLTNNYKVLYHFDKGSWSSVASQLVLEDGKIYGTRSRHGLGGVGMLFEFNLDTKNFQVLNHFYTGGFAAYEPTGLVKSSSGLLIGVTRLGGRKNIRSGVLYTYNTVTTSYEEKLSFYNMTKGVGPRGNLIQAHNGKVYGVTNAGGEREKGVLFEIDPVTHEYNVRHTFGTLPNIGHGFVRNGLVKMGNTIYGVTASGAKYGKGSIFTFDPITYDVEPVFQFPFDMKGYVATNLVPDPPNNKLYGNANGLIFEYNVTTDEHRPIYQTRRGMDGDLLLYNRKLYGLISGYDTVTGELFELDLNTDLYKTLININANGSLTNIGNGRFLGVMSRGGAYEYGTLFEYNVAANSITTKVDFTVDDNGAQTHSPFIKASNGKIYGSSSGPYLCCFPEKKGLIFEYDVEDDQYEVKHHFNGTDGRDPWASLLEINSVYVGVNEKENKPIVSVYPNPTPGRFNINGSLDQDTEIEVYDLLGNVVFSQKVKKLNLSGIELPDQLNSGIYFVRYQLQNQLFTDKLTLAK